MKRNVLKRSLALLLAMAILLSVVPMGALAAIGDILVGDTGVVNDTLGDGGTINWPIKIYDYLNDGMLFEPATSSLTNGNIKKDSLLDGWYGLYGGGNNMPETLQGTDYTGNSAHYGSSDSNASIMTLTKTYNYTKVPAEHFVSPQYLRVEKMGTTTGDRLCLVNFVRNSAARKKNNSYQQCLLYDEVRYMTLVYKSQGTGNDDETQIWLESYPTATIDSNGFVTKSGTWGRVQIDIDIPDSSGWKALVIDLATIDSQMINKDTAAVTTWDAWKACTAVYLNLSGLDTGDYLDISHVSVFGSREEAELYGQRCLEFNNNPGECLLQARTITWTTGGDGVETTVTMPTVSRPSFNFGYNSALVNTLPSYSASDVSTTTNYYNRLGLDLTTTGSKGYTTTVYNTWENPSAMTLYSGTGQAGAVSFTPTKQNVEVIDDGDRDYVRITNSATGSMLLSNFNENNSHNYGVYNQSAYLVIVYRTHGLSASDQYGFWAAGYSGPGTGYANSGATHYRVGFDTTSSWSSNSAVYKHSFQQSDELWVYDLIPLGTGMSGLDSNYSKITYHKYIGWYLPALTGGKSIDLAYAGFFRTEASAQDFAEDAAGFMNSGKTVTITDSPVEIHTVTFPAGRTWNAGNNGVFGMYHGNQGGSWASGGYGGSSANVSNGYYTYRIGYAVGSDYSTAANQNRMPFGNTAARYSQYTLNTTTKTLDLASEGRTNQIFFVGSTNSDGDSVAGFNTGILPLDNYNLLTNLTTGGCTIGMLEGISKDGRPVYRQETVEYIAEMLYNALTIPQFDMGGNYNYNFISGAKSSQFATDLNGDGDKSDMFDTNGDLVLETNEASMDLATALRHDLGIKFTLGTDRGTTPTYGDYAATAAKDLIGTYQDCRGSIKTCMDAAYFLLNNIFVSGSYNQEQDDFRYLTLSHATLEEKDDQGNNKTAYVFDAGFATKVEGYTEGDVISIQSPDKDKSTCAVDYNYFGKTDANGNYIGDGTISLMEDQVGSKGLWYYYTNSTTTRFPFLPVVNAEGPYAEPVYPPTFRDDGVSAVTSEGNTYAGRNYNYVMASNGEFVYFEEENLFFEFEGDDDVYLFINGQLVLDIGGAHSITAAEFKVNDYVAWARALKADADAYAALSDAEKARVDALALTEGEICQFDFYYMERHGTGANCRIVTNMHVTDPKLKVEKSAQQFGEQITYGGVVDSSAPVGYTFKLTNTGNTKLYNLNFVDDVIGVTLDPQQGLVIKEGWNGANVFDARGGTLEASDLTATVTGVNAAGVESTIQVTFGDNNALINFLQTLSATGLEEGRNDAEVTHAGSGLWVDASVTITGMFYHLNAAQKEEGMLHNTVYVTATTKIDSSDAGSQILRSDASHRVFTSGAPVYYQWAGHEIFLSEIELLNDATGLVWDDTYETIIEDNQLTQYSPFFKGADKNIYNIYTILCDKKGNSYTYSTVSMGYRGDGGAENWGFFINYPKSGSYTFYVLMYLNESVSIKNEKGETITGNPNRTDVADLNPGTYAIIPVTVTVADVKDSTFVLDYGLGTESLDMDGELFNQDELFGSSGSVKAKLMGLSTTQPGYLDAQVVSDNDFNRISFDNWSLSGVQTITPFVESGKADGVYNVNLNIPAHGRPINYDSNIGGYTIVGTGTMTINAVVPATWTGVKLYYWYDGGESPVEWPGTPMENVKAGEFTLDIPGNVTNVAISNAADDSQRSIDLHVTAGVESTIRLSTNSGGSLVKNDAGEIMAVVICSVDSTAYIKVPDWWGDVFLYCWSDDNTERHPWPGVKVTQKNAEGYYVVNIPGDTSKIIVSNGTEGVAYENRKQTIDIDIESGRDVWIETGDYIRDELGIEGERENQIIYALYRCAFTYSRDPITIHAKIPATWGDNISLYAWYSGSDNDNAAWPGQKMTLGADGWYELDLSGAYGNIIITDGVRQTQNLLIEPGMETWLTVEDGSGVRAKVPSDWGSNIYLYAWNSNDEDVKNKAWPGVKMTKGSDGYYHLKVNGEYDRVIINNNGGRQTEDLVFFVNQDTTITVNTNGKVHANVSAVGWGNANLYAWNDGSGSNAGWPGKAMSYSDGWYTLAAGGSYGKIIINNGSSQTEDLPISPGAEVKVILNGGWNNDKAVAEIKYVATVTGDCPVDISYTADGSKEGISFTPDKIMSNKNVLWMAVTVHSANVIPTILGNPIDINNEVQMYKKITVLPANVVYYEDDFVDITYNTASTTNSFTHHGSGSGSLTQSVAQDTPYGSDPTYQAGTNALTSGDSLTKVQIKGTDQVAAFTFTGTGFELISRTNAFDSATIIMKLYEMQMVDGVLTKAAQPLQHIPVITEFDNGGDGGTEEICQVPVIRVNDLAHGTYLVEISGNPAYDFSKWDGDINSIDKCMIDTYLYIDGIRVFQPLGEEEVSYNAGESDALFWELRDLIVAGKVAVAQQDGESFRVSAGTTTWTENLRGDDFAAGSAAFVGNQVGSVNDYLIQGPNNEVYMDGTVTDTALAFLVAEQSDASARELQIALRALDYGKFYGVGSTGPDVRLEYGIRTMEGDYRWRPLVNAVSSAEQYYSIPYEQCPKIYDEQNNFIGYQVAIRAVNGQLEIPALVSYTTLKTQGLEICSIPGTGEKTFLYYENGILVAPDYFLQGTVGSKTITKDNLFWDGKLTMTFAEPGYVYFSRLMAGETRAYQSVSGDSAFTAADAAPTDTANMLYVPAGEITFTLTEKEDGVATLTYSVAGSGEAGGETQVAEVNLNLYALRQQMIAGSMEDGEVNAGERVQIPEMNSTGASLSFDDEIHYNFYYTVDDATDVEEMGLAIFADKLSDGIITDAVQVIPGYFTNGDEYMVRTEGISAKNMGDTVWFKIYARLSDGTYAYSDVGGYNAVAYAKSILTNSQNAEMRRLVVSMLNYGTEAQLYFGYKTDELMNSFLTAEQKALVDSYDESMVAAVVSANSAQTAAFPKTSGTFGVSTSVSFDGAFSVNYYFTAKKSVDNGMKLYYWDAATYNSGVALTKENATKVTEMVANGSEYWAQVSGIAAKEIDQTIYVAAVYESEGVEYTSGVTAYSLGHYCKTTAAKETSSMKDFAKATAVYGYYAKQFFAK